MTIDRFKFGYDSVAFKLGLIVQSSQAIELHGGRGRSVFFLFVFFSKNRFRPKKTRLFLNVFSYFLKFFSKKKQQQKNTYVIKISGGHSQDMHNIRKYLYWNIIAVLYLLYLY